MSKDIPLVQPTLECHQLLVEVYLECQSLFWDGMPCFHASFPLLKVLTVAYLPKSEWGIGYGSRSPWDVFTGTTYLMCFL